MLISYMILVVISVFGLSLINDWILQIWKYQGTDRMCISALEHLNVDVQTLEGRFRTDVLLSGSISGSLR